ncbi:diacylglycerol kinase zeta-like, partial [Carassius auratus]|uniref:Diacylglycerol kinase zeta-like n=1 Tax=Carassius auratus TaxID=7957 RepID=A0A6P6MC34_CARAU
MEQANWHTEGELEGLSRPLDGEEPRGPDSASSSCSDLSITTPAAQTSPNNTKSFSGLRIFGRRKAIAKAGVQDNAAQSGTMIPAKCEPNKDICSTVDWTENAQFGQQRVFDTSPSGDFCYVGETYCCQSH